MVNLKPIICLSFTASLGLMFLVLACAMPQYNNWWPLFTLVFYILAPIPVLISRRMDTESNNQGSSWAYFVTTGIIVSAFALPIILSRSPSSHPVIQQGACWLTFTGNIFIFITILGLFLMSDEDNVEYSMW